MKPTEYEHGVTSVTVEINASASFVWEVMTDFERYPDWNPYTVAAVTTLAIDAPIDLTLPAFDGSDGLFHTREFIRIVEPPYHLRYDNLGQIPGVLGSRDQWITELGPGRCSYYTSDTLSGEHAALAMEMTGDWMQAGFDSVARALKTRAEQLFV